MNDDYFKFLNDIRESGAVNMYAGPSLLREEFDLDVEESQEVFRDWQDSLKDPQGE